MKLPSTIEAKMHETAANRAKTTEERREEREERDIKKKNAESDASTDIG